MSKSTAKASEEVKANETAKPSGKAADGAEKTGQETVILTQRPQEQEEYQENKQGSNAKGDQDQKEQGREEHHEHSDSFAQQLRLGLI